MATHSAGILLYRLDGQGGVSAFVAHMGGPYWTSKDVGAWSIPKGEVEDGEEALDAAKREFREELGVDAPSVDYAELGTFAYSSGKRVTVFVADGSGFDATGFVFGEFEMEWPPRSGRTASFPEVDRAEWMPLAQARELVVKGQQPALDRLAELLSVADT
ncbi:NUDIX domain-containing protein [Microbacterium sp. EYE_5]|uniref:NUDIX domain-containing protein n=1 Tax=unclassified Microbacterium TaxID=2609290 RepID=UPI002003C9F6|nr:MULTISPECIES: NUDIX domain-containing protein [unclassified Microbacterium]MCK6079200.1 NUDIX domain-containing protein [Microbacterium sp. EYE_382]MCK6084470.1 NUDIX domain-containing protein [Microbacterium sp. EYE_384]MCK6123301.1 NUDIX domain-containing protein [Microbacterium sp. EYE_80]MCK6125234.1 NUDIX domain-containing protein [Microbacterium sp. EYE_79]MCK6140154.1 NUDIX domain-containing protein [Microbacterium sp. EYE_39]